MEAQEESRKIWQSPEVVNPDVYKTTGGWNPTYTEATMAGVS